MQSKEDVYTILDGIPDPEIPVISIVDLGVIRNISISDKTIEVEITPTYSGCPAMKQIEDDVRKTLKSEGFEEVKIKIAFHLS